MPKLKRKNKSSSTRSSAIYDREFHFLTDNKRTLQLIITAFLALSALLVAHIVNQQEELDLYKEARAVTR
ncbi:hypothetical protein A2716_03785 [candidate division WWE3 bacterium RIFCSPHIGHO2_01_FULL_40_23]|uniref:Uncharacterized protein n=1 Tax=candidate division WWE3 bacterium RIFCSPLOWO2_01_FULL_41_18 TaxID=1802625 RepID=A0A1F4VDE9_UNCKA|nr:MAG: hypothetical protein A2716_03785 [candidate division WWE3 bacterium RIFCSPHIGHO2_01_FULL_40_23]OGC55000.1 MAG: hypothetical protein A3A78_03395 [candidate division WWE3 bacterium RIFCSPLOWO2_01_FULL_41_18]